MNALNVTFVLSSAIHPRQAQAAQPSQTAIPLHSPAWRSPFFAKYLSDPVGCRVECCEMAVWLTDP
jgi:hypothetical protein